MKNKKLLELGNKIRFERMKRGISQEKLAELANISIRTISDIERGITDIRYTTTNNRSLSVNIITTFRFQTITKILKIITTFKISEIRRE